MSSSWDAIGQLFGNAPERPAATERTALFWCTTQEMHSMLLSIDTQTEHFIDDGSGSARPLRVTREDIEWALSFSPDLHRAREAEGRLSFADAAAIYESLLPKTGASDYILMRLGGCYANLGDKHRALLHLEKAASMSPKNAEIQRWLRECRQLWR